MPIDYTEEENIYTEVKVIVNSKTDYTVYNFSTNTTVARGIKDVDTALEIKKAYCDGYYDAQQKYQSKTNK